MIRQGREIAGDLELTADVVVVGSGASGSVIAKELSEAGQDVVVLEEGGYYPPEVYARFKPTETMRHMMRLGGSQLAYGYGDSPTINVLSGRAVGGSSSMTGGVCFRIPSQVHWRWEHELGLGELSERALEPAYRAVEQEIRVGEVPESMRSRGTQLFAKGAALRGIDLKPLRRNAPDCRGAGRCTYGCPEQAKLSVDQNYLKKAFARGVRLYSDCLVERVLSEGGRAAGVEGRVLNGPDGKRGGRLRVRASRVVMCAGALHTPKILARSRIARASGELGRHITLHPAFRVGALFDERVEGWKGALQSVYTDKFEEQGITLVGIFISPALCAATMPGVGPAHAEFVRKVPNLALFGGLVHDDGGGRLLNVPGREPVLVYHLHPRDKKRMLLGMRILAECFFEAGARQVLLPIFGIPAIDSPDQLKVLEQKIPARRFECAAFHPLGSARMGTEASHACVRPSGETFDLPGLFVADGSLFPSSIGVNSQLPIMALATKIAWGMVEGAGTRQ